MKIYIITEGSRKTGLGHLTRCISIYQAFETRGMYPKIIINGDDTIKSFIGNKRHEVFNWIKEKERLINIIKNADFIILDSYLADASFYEDISRHVKTPVYIDDGNRIDYPRGIVVNGTTYAKKLAFLRQKDVTYLIGKEFALFRKEFWTVPKKYICKNLHNVLLFLGGADLKNLASKMLRGLAENYPKLTKNVIVTNGFKNLNKLHKIKDDKTTLFFNPDAKKIKELMLSADISVTTGGQTLYELVKMGVPSIVVSVADNQMKSIEDLEKLGVVDHVGDWNANDLMERVNKAMKKLGSYETRLKTYSKSKNIFTGKSTLHLIDKLVDYGTSE